MRLIGHSWPWISPPRQCSAAAEMMPSNDAADAHRQVVVGAADGRIDRGRDVAVGDHLDARAGLADLGDQVVVPGPVEHHRGDVAHLPSERVGDRLQVLGHALAQVDAALRDRADRHLLHVHPRHAGDPARVARGQDRERAHARRARPPPRLRPGRRPAPAPCRRRPWSRPAPADGPASLRPITTVPLTRQRVDRVHHRLARGRVGAARHRPGPDSGRPPARCAR